MSATVIIAEVAMRVFVTGASGWIGSATTRALVAAGHEVVGLVRSDQAAAVVAAAGGSPVEGTLDDLDRLEKHAAEADAVVHLGFRHDVAFTGDFGAAVATDRRAIDTFGEALAGTGRALLIASGTLGLAPGRIGTEEDQPEASVHPRVANAYAALALADRDVRSIVVRFAPTVHGAGGDHGFVATLAQIARRRGVSGYLGDGRNRWAAVHRDDAADLVRRAIESAPARSVLHATAEPGVETRAIADALGRALHLPVAPIAADEAADHFGFLSEFFAQDAPASSDITQRLLDWTPTGPTLTADIAAGHYPGL
jgi:nucleoside-diphosphate-sugar epimerase